MATTTIRIRLHDREVLRKLSKEIGKPISEVLSDMLDAFERERFIKACNEGYARLRNNPKEWADYVKEREAWDATLADGLDPY